MGAHKTFMLYTGGTIGMVPTAEGFAPDDGLEAALREALPEEMAHVTFKAYDTLLDSSQMGPKDWNRIASDLYKVYDHYDSMIVLHGTDTMAYTASALSFALQNLEKTVVVTGSQIPLVSEGSDALANVKLAIEAAKSDLYEVIIAFGGKALRGNRSIKSHAQDLAGFSAPNHRLLNLSAGRSFATGHFTLSPLAESLVPLIRLYPGMGGEVFAGLLQKQVKGLVLEAFGSGNLPGNADFLSGLKALRASGCLIGVVTECRAGKIEAGHYAAGKALLDLGLVPLKDMTAPCAVAKVAWVLGQTLSPAERAKLLAYPICGEISS